MSTKIHVGNMPPTVSEDDLKSTFGKFGQVETVQIARDSSTGLRRGDAIVAMSSDRDAVAAIGSLNSTTYAGRTIAVSRSPQEDT